ncbi:unnamed protein product [Adineta steineri]|uniref:LicD/FKTN/FKRP nucleotidyltransferase domain-containing protein n=1 Tax=Adineta steineri TaxID=433720 RepID=A0A813M971_9BILA|nr:unnamed protein product [Adineta steineri]CAF0731462.1 unnamed protein product [Adineta steineri]CAF0758300.1 unnamed protein product [Adineta steineri]CAF3633068.1 unnamed protein product [Adineta steineri]CAF3797187.1 unnamed protein product [Adineta steineri]
MTTWESTHPCLTSKENRAKLVYMVKSFTEIMTELNVTHWVDFGTLLGALRYESIVIWDHDADVSFDRKFAELLHVGGKAHKIAKERYNMYLNAAVIVYEGMQTDIYSWNKEWDDGSFIYTKAANRGLELFESQFNDFNASFIDKTVLIPFGGGFVRSPYPPMEFIKQRYPTSYKRSIPFKVSCYFPWNIPHWLFHNQPLHTIE